MHSFLSKTHIFTTGKKSAERLSFIQFCTTPLFYRFFSSSSSIEVSSKGEQDTRHSFTMSYLMNSCGLSFESALAASKRVQFETRGKPDAVLALLKDHGFTHKHIRELVCSYPKLLLATPEKALLPKLEFFYSRGFSRTDTVSIFHSNPHIFLRSVPNNLNPCYDFLKSVVKVDARVATIFKQFQRLNGQSAPSNVAVLRELGMPESSLSFFVTSHCHVLLQCHAKFKQRTECVFEMGFDPKKLTFIQAMHVLASLSKSSMEYKMDIFKRWGWSEDDFRLAFRKFPMFCCFSERKLSNTMDFLVNKMGMQPSAVARSPYVFGFNLEKRVIPRCWVMRVLQLKGLTKKHPALHSIVAITDKQFLSRFVIKYQQHVPQLMDIFQGKLGILKKLDFLQNDNFEFR